MESSKVRTGGRQAVKLDRHIQFRVSQDEYDWITSQINGRSTLSAWAKARVLGQSPRDNATLRHIAALSRTGNSLRELATVPGVKPLMIQAEILKIGKEIERLAKGVP